MQIDKQIASKLKGRAIKPSTSAWERLSNQLDNQIEKKKRKRFFYIGYAASLLLIFSLSYVYFIKTHSKEPVEIISKNPILTIKNESKPKEIIEPKQDIVAKVEEKKQVDVIEEKSSQTLKKQSIKPKKLLLADNNKITIQKKIITKEENKVAISKDNKEVVKKNNDKNKSITQPRITVNSEDLLYAVTHSPEEVKTYYAKYNIKREDVLKTIKTELKKSKLTINPETILAEVERDIDEETFKNNFLKNLKTRVSDIMVSFSGRNK